MATKPNGILENRLLPLSESTTLTNSSCYQQTSGRACRLKPNAECGEHVFILPVRLG